MKSIDEMKIQELVSEWGFAALRIDVDEVLEGIPRPEDLALKSGLEAKLDEKCANAGISIGTDGGLCFNKFEDQSFDRGDEDYEWTLEWVRVKPSAQDTHDLIGYLLRKQQQ